MGVKTERNKQQKRDALLNTAFHLFSTKGMQKTSISDIVEEAGVAKGTFYLYFQDKSDIRNKLISHKASQLFQSAYAAMKATGITSFEEQIIYMVDFILDKLSKDTMLMTFISKHLSWGVFKDPEIMIYLIIELVSGASYSSILYNQPAPLEELKPHIFEIVRHIIKEHYA